MRELARSMASFSWALSLFGVEQMTNLVAPRRAAAAFRAMARSAEGELGPGLRSAFQVGDRLQRSVVDLSFGLAGLGQAGNLAFEALQLGIDTVSRATGNVWQQQQGVGGWGPVPPPPGADPQR